MAHKTNAAQPTSPSAEPLATKLESVGAMNIEQLRSCWRQTFASDPPSAFSRDLLARAISYRLQAVALGDVSASVARLLSSFRKPGAEAPRQVKAGSVIVREYQGVMHEVLVVPGGFCWQGRTFDSLSTIAKKITGTNWNGPRFFGLRSKPSPMPSKADVSPESQKTAARRAGRPPTVLVGRGVGRSP